MKGKSWKLVQSPSASGDMSFWQLQTLHSKQNTYFKQKFIESKTWCWILSYFKKTTCHETCYLFCFREFGRSYLSQAKLNASWVSASSFAAASSLAYARSQRLVAGDNQKWSSSRNMKKMPHFKYGLISSISQKLYTCFLYISGSTGFFRHERGKPIFSAPYRQLS